MARVPLPHPDAHVVDPNTGLMTRDWYDFFRGISSGQLAFPPTQNPSSDPNTLDDYEEGTWTPILSCANPGNLVFVLNTSISFARYVKIGSLVVATFQVVSSTFTHSTASGYAFVSSPFPIAAGGEGFGTLLGQGWNKPSYTSFSTDALGASSQILLSAAGNGMGTDQILITEMPSGGVLILQSTIAYRTEI